MKERLFIYRKAAISTVVLLLTLLTVLSEGFLMSDNAAVARPRRSQQPRNTQTKRQNWLGDLWEEVIEFSTYGPAERKMLKAKREAAAAKATTESGNNSPEVVLSAASFRKAKERISGNAGAGAGSADNDESSSLSLQAFQSAVAASEAGKNTDLDFDGYGMRDLLVSKWGVPLDVDFQRGYSTDQPTVYCTVLPFAFGSLKCRHVTELDYLMHLQAVVEILHEYDNLDEFRAFVETTKRVPKPGVESVPFRLELSPQQLQKVLGVAQ
ncbi:MAG: hypothetical protein SGILL_009064 [Bacillariaceae sp.]